MKAQIEYPITDYHNNVLLPAVVEKLLQNGRAIHRKNRSAPILHLYDELKLTKPSRDELQALLSKAPKSGGKTLHLLLDKESRDFIRGVEHDLQEFMGVKLKRRESSFIILEYLSSRYTLEKTPKPPVQEVEQPPVQEVSFEERFKNLHFIRVDEEDKHYSVGGSTMKYIYNCPAYLSLPKVKNSTNAYAERGTLLHKVMEGAQQDDKLSVYDKSAIDIARWSLNDLATKYDVQNWHQEITIEANESIGGTIDFYGLSTTHTDLVLLGDFKFGRVDVPVQKNAQLFFYAGLLLHYLHDTSHINRVGMVIIQPSSHEPLKVTVLPKDVVLKVFKECIRRVYITGEPTKGSHCTYCTAKPNCPAFMKEVVHVLPEIDNTGIRKLSASELYKKIPTFEMLDHIKTLLKEYEDHLLASIEEGEKIPGYSIKPKRIVRKWVDKNAVLQMNEELVEARGVPLSPAQLQKRCAERGVPFEPFEPMIEGKSSGNILTKEEN